MARWFNKEAEIEYWMRPFTGIIMMPGYKHIRQKGTRLFFDLYWQLLFLGYTERQLSDYVIRKRWETRPPMPKEIAFINAVYQLADQNKLTPSREFNPYLEKNHPRYIIDRYK